MMIRIPFLPFSSRLFTLVILLLSVSWSASVPTDELPRLGENAVFRIDEEVRIAEEVYQQLLDFGLVETDPLLDRYINDLGARLVSAIDHRVRDYRFFIVRDNNINAFALPGGYIGLNTGLILSTRSPDQLASVMAHEIAHVRLRHGIRLVEKSSKVTTATLLGIFAGLLAGVGSEFTAALISGGAASSQQMMVNYTREFEYEADRVGIEILQRAGFDGRGMVEFFQFLDKLSNRSELHRIEYLRTHPVSINRVSEIKARLQASSPRSLEGNYFSHFKDYLLYISQDHLNPAGSDFRQALIQIKSGHEVAANALLADLYHKESDNFWYAILFAGNLKSLNHIAEAEQVYRQLLEIYPDDFIASLNLTRLLREDGRLQEATVIARRLENRYPQDKAVFAELVYIYRRLGRGLLEIMAQADYHRVSGAEALAIELYRKILLSPDLDPITEKKVNEKILLLEQAG